MVDGQKRILVLGGDGFIGEPLVKALRDAEHTVSAPTRAELDVVTEPKKLAKALHGSDTLIILTQPDKKCIKNISSALASSGVQNVLYASTALVYASSKTPVRENAPVRPASDYARRKYEEEEVLRGCPVPATIMRFGNVYGSPKNRGIVQKVIEALYEGTPLPVSGESQVRDFIHVEDIVKAVTALAAIPPAHHTVNIMTGAGTTIGDMFATLERLSGKSLIKTEAPESDPVNVVGSIDNLKELTGFTPKISLEEGFTKTLHSYDRSIQK